ncbi:hypothetical protein JCM10213_008547 [Rhodosporidiobolus nylandii]
MGAFYDEVPENCIDWIKEQKMFWVASAPLSGDGTVNVSPKGHDSFHLASPTTAWYLDITGSGNETLSHVLEPGNGRLTFMFCAFHGPPRILRLFGKGRVFERDTPEFDKLLPPGDERRLPGARSIIWLDIERVGTSCGFSVPYFDYVEDRPTLLNFYSKKEAFDAAFLEASPSSSGTLAPFPSEQKGMRAYWKLKNAESIDGLPGLPSAGFPPEEWAVRKAKGQAKVAGSGESEGREATAFQPRGAALWVSWARQREWRVELGVAIGLVVGIWVGGGGWERVREAVAAQ